MTVMTSEQLHELATNEIEAVSGGVIAIIRPNNRRVDGLVVIGGMDPNQSLLPYIERAA